MLARPIDGELGFCAWMGGGGGARCGTAGTSGSGGNDDSMRLDSARKLNAVIHNACLSADVVVNFRALAGVKIRIDRLKALSSSGFLGKGVSSFTSITDWMVTANVRDVTKCCQGVLTLSSFLAQKGCSGHRLLAVPHDRTLVR